MSYGLSTPIREAELSVKVTAELVRKYGPTITLGDMNLVPDELWPATLGRRGKAELRAAIETAQAYERPPRLRHRSIADPECLTIRDQFAMAALTGMLAAHPQQVHEHAKAAEIAYLHADAMMEVRGK